MATGGAASIPTTCAGAFGDACVPMLVKGTGKEAGVRFQIWATSP